MEFKNPFEKSFTIETDLTADQILEKLREIVDTSEPTFKLLKKDRKPFYGSITDYSFEIYIGNTEEWIVDSTPPVIIGQIDANLLKVTVKLPPFTIGILSLIAIMAFFFLICLLLAASLIGVLAVVIMFVLFYSVYSVSVEHSAINLKEYLEKQFKK